MGEIAILFGARQVTAPLPDDRAVLYGSASGQADAAAEVLAVEEGLPALLRTGLGLAGSSGCRRQEQTEGEGKKAATFREENRRILTP